MVPDNVDLYPVPEDSDNEAIRHLREAVAAGKPWHVALLEAIELWTWPEETCNGHHYSYLIAGEAFDWLLLAERLCQEVAALVPEQELVDLLFFGSMPEEISEDKLRTLLGSVKYRAYLNYFYGVIIEQFLQLAVEEEIHKERQAFVFGQGDRDLSDSYQRIYGASQETLLQLFRQEKGYPQVGSITLLQLQEFTYWLFKYRLNHRDKARVASDTKKGLEYFKCQQLTKMRRHIRKDAADIDDLPLK